MLACRLEHVAPGDAGDDLRVSLQIVQSQSELFDGEQHRGHAVMCFQRQRQHADKEVLGVSKLLLGNAVVAKTSQLGKGRLERALDYGRIDSCSCRPE